MSELGEFRIGSKSNDIVAMYYDMKVSDALVTNEGQ